MDNERSQDDHARFRVDFGGDSPGQSSGLEPGIEIKVSSVVFSRLDLPKRVLNALIRHDILTIDELLLRSSAQLRDEVLGLGPGGVKAIEVALKQVNLRLPEYTGRRYVRSYAKLEKRHVRNHTSWLSPSVEAPSE